MTLFTVGHSTRSFEEFLGLLKAHGIGRLVDVRRYPGSRRYPHFSREALAHALPRADIRYEHEPDLGGRRTPRPDSPNGAWRSASFRAYADYMGDPAWEAALERVRAGAAERATALMCAEAVPWRCHRQLIADVLVARGHEVRHILGPTRADPHELSAHAVALPDGGVCYPDPAARQAELF